MSGRVLLHQLLAGRDFARENDLARSMANNTYVIGDGDSGEVVLVDPAYDVAELLALLDAQGQRLVATIVTHYHADHAGGELLGHDIEGAARVVALTGVAVHAHRDELTYLTRATGLRAEDVVSHDDDDELMVGAVSLTLRHTPGHTPGSICLRVGDALVSGDTLFLDGCGRTDLPGGDAAELYDTLFTRLSDVGDDVVLYPGHRYSPEASMALGEVRRRNGVLRPVGRSRWLAAMGS